jgi:hypothetical protein
MLANAQLFYACLSKKSGCRRNQIQHRFHCKVKPADLKTKLHLFSNEKEIPFDVIGGDPDYAVGVTIADLRGDSKESIPFKIQIDPGSLVCGSSYSTKDKMEFTSEIPTKEKLMITQMSATFIEGSGQVNVFTNQPVINEISATLFR